MARTCCPQYTIRLDALAYKPTKKQRQVINRFNRYLGEGVKSGGEPSTHHEPSGTSAGVSAKSSAKAKAREWEFMAELKKYEGDVEPRGKHRYWVMQLVSHS